VEVKMAAITRTEVSKVVRKMLEQEQGDANEATLKALQRVAELLREKVIPQLPDQPGEEEPDGENVDDVDDIDEDTHAEMPESEEEAPVDVFAREASARGYPHLPCRKGGPAPADNKVASQIRPKLRGSLRGALDGQRICCARQIVGAAKARRLHKRAAVIAVTTAIVESTLLNINKEIDHDSLGLFQQRAGWGSRPNRLNPTWATNAFLNAMLKKYPRNAWLSAPIGKVCQRVQVSAFPGRYQLQAADAAIIVGALWGAGRIADTEATPMAAEESKAKDLTLRAIQQLNTMLTEQVIPRLSGMPGAERPDMEHQPHDEGPDDIDSPEIPEEDSPDAHVPAAVTEALAALYQRLSADQADSLAALFTAVSEAHAEGAEDESAEESEVEAPSR
jgi:hypothetical protein